MGSNLCPNYQVELKARNIADDLQQNIMPNLVGMGLQDAIFLLENYGLKVDFLVKEVLKDSLSQKADR